MMLNCACEKKKRSLAYIVDTKDNQKMYIFYGWFVFSSFFVSTVIGNTKGNATLQSATGS